MRLAATAVRPALADIDVHAAWTGTFGSAGLRATLASVKHSSTAADSSVFVRGVVHRPDGSAAGRFARMVVDESGERRISHGGMRLEVKRTGFASGFNAHAEAHYRDWGVEKVRVTASDDGVVAWARGGFGFDTTARGRLASAAEGAAILRTYLDDAVSAQRIAPAERARVLELDPPASTPGELVNLDDELARRVLSEGWFGIKLLG